MGSQHIPSEDVRREWESIHRELVRRGPRRSPLLSHFDTPLIHFSILPANPLGTPIPFHDEFWDWWSLSPTHPVTGEAGTRAFQLASTSADAVLVRRNGRLEWESALAIQRSGLFQSVLTERSALWSWKEQRVFALVPLVGWIWTSMNRFGEAVVKYELDGPFRVSLVVFDTAGALLGTFGEGWLEPNHAFSEELTPCTEHQVRIQLDIPTWPDASDLKELVFLFGERIDNAWGSHSRRFLNRTGRNLDEFSFKGP